MVRERAEGGEKEMQEQQRECGCHSALSYQPETDDR